MKKSMLTFNTKPALEVIPEPGGSKKANP